MFRFLILISSSFFIGFGLLACATLQSIKTSIVGGAAEHSSGAAPSDAPAGYRVSVSLLENGKYEEALKGFDVFIQQNAASPWSQAAILNSGRSLEGLKRWTEAADRYRQVVRATANSPKLQAMALYHLSNCHEAVGDDPQVVADLLDLQARSKHLPVEIAQAELPARLAAGYARVGQFERAQEFYRRAESGIAKLRQKAGADVPDWLPKTLFLMGESSRRHLSWTDFETSLRPLARSQIYLLEAAETGRAPFADRAATELTAVYDDLMSTIEGAPLPQGEPVVAKRALQRKQWERAALLIETVNALRARDIPGPRNAAVLKINLSLEGIDLRLAKLFGDRPAGEGLTESSLARKKSGQRLKSLATDDSLEQQFLKSSRQMTPAQNSVPKPEPTPQPVTETPWPPDIPAPIRALPNGPTSEDPNL